MGAPYDIEDMERAILLAKSRTWPEVGAIMERPWRSLYNTVRKYKSNDWQKAGKTRRSNEHNKVCEEMAIKGKAKLKSVARTLGVSKSAACRRLALLGLDAEMRAILRKEAETLSPKEQP